MKKELQVKGCFENNVFKPTHLKITKAIAEHELNSHLKLSPGYVAFGDPGCPKGCPSDTSTGYYQCVGGNCVYVPFS